MKKLILGLAVSSMILTACNKEPELSMAASATEVAVGESVTFTNNTEMKKAYNMSWSFGDGGSANTWHASHSYSEPGEYTVTLAGTSRKGNKASTATAVVTVTPSDYDVLEDKREASDVASDVWWTAAVGTWGLTSATDVQTDCTGGKSVAPTAYVGHSKKSNTDANKMTFTIVQGGDDHDNGSYVMNNNGEKMTWSFDYLDDTHVNIDAVDIPYTVTGDNNIHRELNFPNGVYTYTNSGTTIVFTKVVEHEITWNETLTSDDKYCVSTQTFTFTITKQ